MNKKRVLFVCRGNIFRSRVAESILKKYKLKNLVVKSAGIEGGKHGNVAENTYKVMKEIKIPLIKHKPVKLLKIMLKQADIVILMDEKIARDENWKKTFRKYKNKIKIWNIPDKDKKDVNGIRKVRNMINKKILNLIRNEKL
jgi:protein-tyrosine-phosphatase